jgi:hypothetical protein
MVAVPLADADAEAVTVVVGVLYILQLSTARHTAMSSFDDVP